MGSRHCRRGHDRRDRDRPPHPRGVRDNAERLRTLPRFSWERCALE